MFVIVNLLISVYPSQPVCQKLTIKHALEEAYKNNPDLLSMRESVKSGNHKITQAKAGWKPKIYLKSGINTSGYSRSGNAKYFRNIDRENTYGAWNANAGIHLQQNLYQGGKTKADVKQSEESSFANWSDLYSREQRKFLDIALAYIELISIIDEISATKQHIDIMEKIKNFAIERTKAGAESATQISEAEAVLFEAQAINSNLADQYEKKVAEFKELTGIEFKNPDESLNVNNMLFIGASQEIDIVRTLEYAKSNNPMIINAIHQKNASSAAIEAEKSRLRPEVNLVASSSRSTDATHNRVGNRKYSFNKKDNKTESRIGIEAQWSLYEGGEARAKIREARDNDVSKKIAIEKNIWEVRKLVESSAKSYKITRESIDFYKREVAAQNTKFDNLMKEVEVGSRILQDALEAKRSYLNAIRNLISAEKSHKMSSFQLLFAMGKLDPKHMALCTPKFDPKPHFDKAKDRRF